MKTPSLLTENQKFIVCAASVSLVCGIGSWLLLVTFVFVLVPVAVLTLAAFVAVFCVVFGHISRKIEKDKSINTKIGRFALPSLVMGYTNIAASFAVAFFWIVGSLFGSFSNAFDKSLSGDAGPRVIFSQDETLLVTYGKYRQATVWLTESGQKLFTFGPENSEGLSMDFSADGTRIAYIGRVGRMRSNPKFGVIVVDARSGTRLERRSDSDYDLAVPIWRQAYDRESRREMNVNFPLANAIVSNSTTGKVVELENSQNAPTFAYSPDGSCLVSGITSGERTAESVWGIQIWHAETGSIKLFIPRQWFRGFVLGDSRIIGVSPTSNKQFRVQLFDINTGESTLSITCP